MSTLRLGRRPRPPGARYLRLRDYTPVSLPRGMEVWDGTPGATFKMYGNDSYGDCTIAAVANHASMQAAAAGMSLSFPEKVAVDYYLAMTGGKDEGAVEVEVLALVAKNGFPAANGYRLRAWAAIDHHNRDEVRAAACAFTGVYLGVALPDDFEAGLQRGLWEVTGRPNPDNGHAIIMAGYDPDRVALPTWGLVLPATWDWMDTYVEEMYVLLDETHLSLDVLNGAQLIADAAALAAQMGAGG